MAFVPLDSTDAPEETKGFVPLEATKPKPDIKDMNKQFKLDQEPHMFRAALGMAEVIAAGVGDLANTAVSGVTGLAKATIAKTAGLPFIDTFSEEFNKSYQGISNTIPYMPETPEGDQIFHELGDLVMKGLKFVGDAGVNGVNLSQEAYRQVRGFQPIEMESGVPMSAAAAGMGAGSQALAALATLMVPGRRITSPHAPKENLKGVEAGMKEQWDNPKYVQDWAQKNYPETLKNLQASSVGKTIKENYQAPDVYNKIHKELDVKLGLAPDSGKSITQKFMELMDSIDPAMPKQDKLRIVDSTLSQLDTINRLANIDKTPQQLLDARIIRPEQTVLDVIERQVGIKQKDGRTPKQAAEDFQAALNEHQGWVIDPVTQIERPLTAGEYLDITTRQTQAPKTANKIVEENSKGTKLTTQQIIDEMTGVNRNKPADKKAMAAALKEPSGVWVVDASKGSVERQLTMGEYWEVYSQKNPKVLPTQPKPEIAAAGSKRVKVKAPKELEAFDHLITPDAPKDMVANVGKSVKFNGGSKGSGRGTVHDGDFVITGIQKDHAGNLVYRVKANKKDRSPAEEFGMVANPNEITITAAGEVVQFKGKPGGKQSGVLLNDTPEAIISNWKTIEQRRTQLANNASGESAASAESISRLQAENAQGIKKFVIDPNRNQVTPLKTVDRVDQRAKAGQVIVEQAADGTLKVVENNSGMGNEGVLNRSKQLLGKPGGKQAGVLLNDTPEAVAANAKALRRIEDASKNITAAGTLTESRFKEIDRALEEGRLHDPNRPLNIPAHAADSLVRGALDTSGPMKNTLQKFGQAGNTVKMKFNLIKGAPGRSQLVYNEYSKAIYKDLNHADIINLDKIIRARRVVAIDQYKGVGAVQHVARSSGPEMEAFANSLRSKLGQEKYSQLDAAADKYFRAYQDQLRKMHDEGLVSDDAFIKMFNLEYSPTEHIKFLDPERSFTFGGKTITVRDSGIQDIGKGAEGAVRMNSKELLAEHILRTETRVMKNEANLSLRKFGEDVPDAGFVRPVNVEKWNDRGEALGVPDAPPGFTTLYAMQNGRQQPMYVADWFAEQWVTRPSVMTAEFSRFLSLASGTAMVKTLATTMNPAFALVNMPRDMMHIWIADPNYSTWAPVAAMQLGKDMAVVAKDAFTREGRWKEFVKEGGSQEYLSEQGPIHFMGNQVTKMTSSWQPVYKALTYMGTTSEAWTRLALRERAMKNGKQSWEASAAAREYLDFTDGGSWTKGADTVMPYLNAATQATYTAAKQAKRDPLRTAVQATQVLGASIGMVSAAVSMNPEAWQQIPTEKKLKNFIIAPKDMFVIDPDGNKRHVYFTLPIDGNWVPVNALGVGLVEKYHFDKVPDGTAMEAIQSASPLLQGMPIPSITAGATYASNHNFWRDDAVWKGARVNPEDEVIPPHKAGATPQMFVEAGQLTGMSPERLRAAIAQLAPSNPYTDLMGGGFQHWLAGADDRDKAKMTMQMVAENPILRRVVKLTHPFTAEVEALDEAERNRNSQKGKQSDVINQFVWREANGQGVAKDDFRTWIATQPPEDRDSLTKQFVSKYTTDKVFRQLKTSDGIPSQTWWRATSMADPRVRGDVFYWEWVQRDQPERDRMMRVAKALSQQGGSYWSEEFVTTFGKQRKVWGDDKR